MRYLKKIYLVGVDPAAIPSEQFSSECLPPIEVSDLLSYLVLETSYYTNKQFKAFKSLEVYNQTVSGFVASVQRKEIAGKIVVVAKVRHSQRMNDPLVNIWMIVEKDGTIMRRSTRNFNIPPPPPPPGNPRAFELLKIGSFKFPPPRTKMVFKCPTLSSDLSVKCPS